MISPWHDLPGPESFSFLFLTFSLRILIKNFRKGKAYMINYSYIDYQTRVFFETRHILQQIGLNLDTFGRNEGNFGEKKVIFQWLLNSSSVS